MAEMKKQYFFKEYPIYGDFDIKSTKLVPTVEVDFDEIEKGLPTGSRIRHATVQTVIVGEKFVVYGEYSTQEAAMKQAVATESIDIDDVLGDADTLPSVN